MNGRTPPTLAIGPGLGASSFVGGEMFKRLPDILREHERDLVDAFAKPLLEDWREGWTYHEAEQPAAIGKVLIDAIHTDLSEASIAYVYRKKMSRLGKITLATASLAGAKLEFFTGIDLLIQVNWEYWFRLSPDQRVALVDHELLHFTRETTEKGIQYGLVGHDVEEFERIIHRWGLWKPDLRAFARTAGEAHQRSLFEAQAEAEATR